MDQSLKDKTLENITKAQSVLIIVNPESETDGLAAGLGLCLSMQKLGKNAAIIAKEPSVGDALKLYGVDKIGKYKGNKNLVVVIDNAVETIDRVSHFLDGDKLKLILHVFPQSNGITQSQITFEEEGVKPDVAIAIGYTSEDQLRKGIDRVQNIDSTTWLINVSRADLGQIFAQVNVFDPNGGSLSEIIGNLINQLALPLDEDIAYNLYTGISHATSMFSPGKTSPTSLEIASWLLKFGAGKASFAQGGSQFNRPVQAESPRLAAIPQPLTEQKSAQSIFAQTPPPSSAIPNQPVMPRFTPTQAQENVAPTAAEPEPQSEAATPPKNAKSWLNPPKIYKGSTLE